MSKEQEVGADSVLGGNVPLTPAPAGTGNIVLTPEQLQQIIAGAVESAGERSARILAEALIESRKPYKDPKQEANEAADRERDRNIRKYMEENLARDRENCQHIQGSNALSEYPNIRMLTSIIHHQTDDGNVIGICTNCQKVWRPGDKDYGVWMRKASGNRMSQSGQRFRVFVPPPAPAASAPEVTPAA